MAIPLTPRVWQNALYIVVWLSSEWQAIDWPSQKYGEQTLAPATLRFFAIHRSFSNFLATNTHSAS